MASKTNLSQCLNEINLRISTLYKLHDNFILYGYGEIGQLIEPFLRDKLVAIFDQRFESVEKSAYFGLDIRNPAEMESFRDKPNLGVIICLDRKIPQLIEYLESVYGEGNIYSFYFTLDDAVGETLDTSRYPNIDKTDTQVFFGKKVIIIGPAPTSLEYMRTVNLDDFDLVVRINKSPNFTKFSPELGIRTDYLFHCLYEHPTSGGGILIPEILKHQGVKSVIYTNMDERCFGHLYKAASKYPDLSFQLDSGESYFEIMETYTGKMPSTGLQAIAYILNAHPAELHITGFTFFSTPHIGGYHTVEHSKLMAVIEKSGNHVVSSEIETFSLLYKKSLQLPETKVVLE